MPKMFDVEKFLKLIHERRLLWDKNITEYSDRTNRDLAWIEIGEVMYNNWLQLALVEKEEKVKLMKSKWRHLRDNYLKSVKEDKLNSKRKKYIYADRMAFLSEVVEDRDITPKRHKSSGNKSKIINDNYEANEYCSSDTIEDTYQLQDSQPNLPPTKKCQNTKLPILRPKLPALRPNLSTVESNLLTIEPILPTVEPKIPTAKHVTIISTQEEDADLMFFNSLLPDYKELDEEEKLDFRIKCLQFIRDARKSRKS